MAAVASQLAYGHHAPSICKMVQPPIALGLTPCAAAGASLTPCCGGVRGQGGKAAAETVLEMRRKGNFSKAAAQAYERRWMQAYGHDFEMVGPPTLGPLTCCVLVLC